MAPKKGKNGNGNKKKTPTAKGRKNANKSPAKSDIDNKLVQQSQLNPQDRVAFVRPLWESLSDADRVELLTVCVEDVEARLKQQQQIDIAKQDVCNDTETEVFYEKIYERGLQRLNAQGTWKVWQWNANEAPYACAETFKKEVLETRLPEELRALLPREDGRTTEKPAETALRERMTALINNIHHQLQSAQDAWRRGQRAVPEGGEQTRDANIDLVISILESLQHEHQCLYHTILTPVAEFICALVPAKKRKSTKTELFFEDFEKITPEDVAKLYEWLTEKVDALCSKLKPDPKDEDIDEDEEAVGDIDLFSLTEDKTAFTVNAKWLEHLQDRKLSDEGQPRKVKEGEDAHRVGLVLEWVYGSIVSTAEKARDGAKRSLGNWHPSVQQSYQNLLEMLKDQSEWDARCKSAKSLLKEMGILRRSIAALAKQYDVFIPGTAAAKAAAATCEELPDAVIQDVLRRESLLTQAKLHILKYERLMASTQLKTIRAELMQSEPEFERLKRELENAKTLVKNSDKERQRPSKVNESLLEDQLEVQSAFREQGTRLQGMYEKRQRTELEMNRREQEIHQLENWHKNVTQLLGKLQNCLDGEKSVDETVLEKVRSAFHKDFKKQLYSDADDHTFSTRIKTELKTVEKRVEDGAVVLQHLEMFLINVSCDDPGALVGTSIILPMLQERLDKRAMEFSMQKASEAMDALLRMEEEKKELKAKKELKRKAKNVTQADTSTTIEEPTHDDTADESPDQHTEAKPEKLVSIADQTSGSRPTQEPVSLGSDSMENPAFVQQSIRYEATLMAEDITEFQSVSNRKRGDRRKNASSSRRSAQNTSQKHHASSNRPVEEDHEIRRSASGPASNPVNRHHQGAKAFSYRPKDVRFAPSSRPAKGESKKTPSPGQSRLRKNASLPEVSRTTEETKSAEQRVQKGVAAWVKGAIPKTVIARPKQTCTSPMDAPRSSSGKQSAASESSVNVPMTPDASDVDRCLETVRSDPAPKDASSASVEEFKADLSHQTDIQELECHDYEHGDVSPEMFRGDGEQFFNMVQAMHSKADTSSQRERLTDDDDDNDDDLSEVGSELSARSSDPATPEPAHVTIGPPLMPPPMGLPPPIGHIPAFHPNFYAHPVRPMMDPNGMQFPLPLHPPLVSPVTTAPAVSEPGSPSASTPPPPAAPPTHAYPFYAPHMMPPGSLHMPMSPYLPVMPYGQWFPPGISPMGSYENQVRKFPLRPTAEEFVPPSLRNDESISAIDEEETSEDPLRSTEDDSNQHSCSTVDLPEVNESAVTVTQTIEQTC